MPRGWQRNGSPMVEVAEEKFGSSIMQVTRLPAGNTTSLAAALAANDMSASANNSNGILSFRVSAFMDWSSQFVLKSNRRKFAKWMKESFLARVFLEWSCWAMWGT